MARDAQNRQTQNEGFNRLQRISSINQGNIRLVRNKQGVFQRHRPGLTKDDIRATLIHPADLSRFSTFLRQPKTGIIRLQSATVCKPDNLIIQANPDCPNNINGKATGYSFRTDDYNIQGLSDVFFTNDKLSLSGVFAVGVFANLGDVEIDTLNLTNDGIKQLSEFQPSADEAEIAKQYQIFAKGMQIGNHRYKKEIDVNPDNTYVLRTIAYKGRIFRTDGANRINILENDERKDITVVFRIVRKHEDGSITLLWKELDRKAPPKIVLEEKKNQNEKGQKDGK